DWAVARGDADETPAKAEPLRREMTDLCRQKVGADSKPYAAHLAALGLNLLRQQKWADAEPVLSECLAIRRKREPGQWTTFSTQSMLGGALLGQKKYDEAGPLLRKGYRGMIEREEQIPPHGRERIGEALDRLIALYAATNKPDEAKKYKAARKKYPDLLPPPLQEK